MEKKRIKEEGSTTMEWLRQNRPFYMQPYSLNSVSHLVGPVRFALLEHPVTQNRVLVFGDTHKLEPKCRSGLERGRWAIHIIDFLYRVFVTDPSLEMDFYLEAPYATSSTKELFSSGWAWSAANDYLTQMYRVFNICLSVDKSKCPFPNVRFHYVDIRPVKELSPLLYHLSGISDALYAETVREEEWMKLQQTQKKLHLIDLPGAEIQNVLQRTKIQKQMDAIQDKDVRDRLDKHFRGNLEHYLERLKRAPQDMDKLLEMADLGKRLIDKRDFEDENSDEDEDEGDEDEDDEEEKKPKDPSSYIKTQYLWRKDDERIEKILVPLQWTLMKFPAILVDWYTVARFARLFQSRSRSKESKETKETKRDVESQRRVSIFYSGDGHALEQIETLENVFGYKKVLEVESNEEGSDFQCLPLHIDTQQSNVLNWKFSKSL